MRQQPRDWGSLFNLSEFGGGGAQLLLISFATTRLHGIWNGGINGMEEGGGAHSSPTALGQGICAPHPPQISMFFVWDWEGAQKCFILRDHTTGDLKSYHLLQAWVTLTALSVPPRPPFLSVFLGHSRPLRGAGGPWPPGPHLNYTISLIQVTIVCYVCKDIFY